jgi:hypothetical protein
MPKAPNKGFEAGEPLLDDLDQTPGLRLAFRM